MAKPVKSSKKKTVTLLGKASKACEGKKGRAFHKCRSKWFDSHK